MFPRILSGRRITGLAATRIHVVSGSRSSGALSTISRSDAATEAALFCRASCFMQLMYCKLTALCCEEQRLTWTKILIFLETHGIGFDMENSFGRKAEFDNLMSLVIMSHTHTHEKT
jgi:hypothetical protein